MKAINSIITAIVLSIGFSATANANDIYGEYVRNYDGDTVTVNLVDLQDIDLNETYAVFWKKISIRVNGRDLTVSKALSTCCLWIATAHVIS